MRLLTRREVAGAFLAAAQLRGQSSEEPHLGNLYPMVQREADRSPLELSFLRKEFHDLRSWQRTARDKVFDLMSYRPAPVAPDVKVLGRSETEDYIEERITFQTTDTFRAPAHILIPKKAKLPAPGIVALHSHDGIYLWGREKVVATEDEHPFLTDYKARVYGGKSIAVEMARRGYVVIAIDMFYWGERRMLLESDRAVWKERPKTMDNQDVIEFNRRASSNESLTARSLMTAGITWPGIMMWDDIRTLDYLASRPEVDSKRLGCVGLSVGGYRSFMLAALDPRIKTAVAVGWMTSFPHQIRRNTMNTMGLSFMVPNMYRYFDLPDLAACIAPRAVMVMNGTQDRLFDLTGVKAAFAKIEQCYRKAGAPVEKQSCRFYDVPHQFNGEMQLEGWDWLAKWM